MRMKAVSPVIATLLMIALAVSASIIVYVWSTSLLGSMMGSGGTQVKEQLSLEAYRWENPASLVVTLRNVGSNPVVVAGIYVNSVIQQGSAWAIPVGATLTTTIPVTGIYTIGQAYTLKVASADGAVFVFQVVCGQTG